jgi:hypothetical protein
LALHVLAPLRSPLSTGSPTGPAFPPDLSFLRLLGSSTVPNPALRRVDPLFLGHPPGAPVAATRGRPWIPTLLTSGDRWAGPLRAGCLSRQPRRGGLLTQISKTTIKIDQIRVLRFRASLNRGPHLDRPPLRSAPGAQSVEKTFLVTARAPIASWNLPAFILPP